MIYLGQDPIGITTEPNVSGKADKVANAVNGNFAALDSNGNLTDSGHSNADYVQKSAIEDAGITGYTYSTLFGGQFSVTTAASNDYISPYVRASVTGRISKHYMHRVTFNGTEYILPTRLWFNDDASLKVYEYLGNLNLFISDVSGIPGGTDNVPFVIISDLNDSGSIDVLTQTSGTYTIKVEQIVPTKKDLPKTLIYGDNYAPIEKINNGGTYNGFNIGVNELANTRATFAVGYGNQIAHEFGIAVGRRNSLSSETGGGGTAVGTGNTISAAGGMTLGADNVVSGASAVAVGNGLIANTLNTTVLGMYNVPANTTFENFQTNHFYTSGTVVKGTWSSIIPVTFTCVCKADHISGNSSYLYNDVDSQGHVYWEQISSDGDSTLIIGNGTVNERSNAIKIDIMGNCRINGNVYVNCNADSSGGTQLPTDIQINGTSIVSNSVANIPISSQYDFGVVKNNGDYGVYTDNNGFLRTSSTSTEIVKAGNNSHRTIKPNNQHEAAFYGLAKAAGADMASSSNPVGTYTNAAKTAIQTMLGVESGVSFVEQVTGTTPVITGIANTRYVCGEVTSISITPPATGIIDVTFTSGTTPAVLTIPNTVTFPAWFDPTTLDANKIYEINIVDGVRGVVTTW